jgi:hypothetical protein
MYDGQEYYSPPSTEMCVTKPLVFAWSSDIFVADLASGYCGANTNEKPL